MSKTIEITSINFSGETAEITLYPDTGGTVNFVSHIIPYTVELDYIFGEYNLFFPSYNQNCVYNLETSPYPSVTPIITSTLLVTPTPSITPTQVGTQFYAYIVPEPQDDISGNDLGEYLYNNGSNYFGYYNDQNIPSELSSYSDDMNIYIHYSGWTGSSGNFVRNVNNFKSSIRQQSGSGFDSFGCHQSQYNFGTIEINTSDINPNIQYNYTIWIPLEGVGGVMNNMTVDIGLGTSCTNSIILGATPDPVLSLQNVLVTSGATIPAGTYRILWNFVLPATIPLTSPLFFKGDTKI